MSIWVVIPAYNEAESLPVFIPELAAELAGVDRGGQILVVDDGSTDATGQVLDDLGDSHLNLHTLTQGRNLGKARALQRGFQHALDSDADLVVMMDADGQDNPAALPDLLAELDRGNGLVSGARSVRRDRFVKRSTSRLYNAVTRVVGGAPTTDNNSGFKMMRPGVVEDVIPLMYGELHRYITVIAHWSGHRISEVTVDHRPRRFGHTKYGLNRFWRGFLDLVTIRFLLGYESRPFHLFGLVGVFGLLLGGVILSYLTVTWFLGDPIGERPLLILGVLLVVAGLQLMIFGLLAELLVYLANRNLASQRAHTSPR